jgi:hypothetical protein
MRPIRNFTRSRTSASAARGSVSASSRTASIVTIGSVPTASVRSRPSRMDVLNGEPCVEIREER